jgi:hypothetical protein
MNPEWFGIYGASSHIAPCAMTRGSAGDKFSVAAGKIVALLRRLAAQDRRQTAQMIVLAAYAISQIGKDDALEA